MLSGKTAVVTGASRGIGRAIAEKLAAEGAFVVINYNGSKEAAETVLAGIRAAGGDGCVMQCNVSDFAACEAWMKEILALYGKIDILVNNAGGYPSEIYDKVKKQAIKIWEWTEAQWDQIIKTNLRIPFLCINKVVPVMIKQGGGDIVSVSSRMGRIASQMGAYAVAKGGIITLTKTTAIQTQEYGIKVNAVSPGIVDTPGQRVYNHNVGQDDIKMGSAQDVAKAIRYLLCDSPAVMTGQSIDLFTTV